MKQRLERALRAIDGLPEDDWQPEHWDVFTVARRVIADEVARMDRTEAYRHGWMVKRLVTP